MVGTAEVRLGGLVAEVVVSGSEPPGRPPPVGPGQVGLAAFDRDVAEALALMGRTPELGWIELWKVYEIVRHNIRPAKVTSLGWVTTNDESAFTASANRPDISGQRARHARMPGHRPRRTMSERAGRQFISGLVAAWLAWFEAEADAVSG